MVIINGQMEISYSVQAEYDESKARFELDEPSRPEEITVQFDDQAKLITIIYDQHQVEQV